MFDLFRCTQTIGGSSYIAEPPAVTLREAWFIPGTWGMYDHGRRLIIDSGYFRGSGPELVNGSYALEQAWPRQFFDAPSGEDYYFLGPMHTHYGHFLLATFSRLWALAAEPERRRKLVVYNLINPKVQRFAVDLLSAVGYGLGDCVCFDRPTRFRDIEIAAPAFEETNYVHQAYRDLCLRVGNMLTAGTVSRPSDSPVYLAKFGLPGGVARLENEEVVADRLSRRGVEIVFPERLALRDQVRLLKDRVNVAGLLGSAFHTTSFVPSRRLMMLAYTFQINSNQPMIDRVCDHDALYLYPPGGVSKVQAQAFSVAFSLNDPERVADSFCRIFDVFLRPGLCSRQEPTVDLLLEPSVRGTSNVALYCHTDQVSSSLYQSRGLSPAEDSRGGVSGFCTGGFQFHTAADVSAWWSVDLGYGAVIREVRLFNRMDGYSERASRIALLLSNDGVEWVEVYRREVDEPFGGVDGHPLSWTPDYLVRGRHLRVKLLTQTALHLDQVAVYAEPGIVPTRLHTGPV